VNISFEKTYYLQRIYKKEEEEEEEKKLK